MKIDRRSFLSFVMGGAAGTALTPLPWKLMDDSSIWTQMWAWTPVPQDGEVSYENTVCTLCPGHCGLTVRKVENRVVKIEGMKGHPVNSGGICLLGLSGPQLLYGPRRVNKPLKKLNGRFVRITWDDALNELAGQLTELIKKGKGHKFACISGAKRGTEAELLKRFLTACGSSNFFHVPSIQDLYETTLRLMQGGAAIPGFDFENSDYVISFGSGLLDGWGAPVRMFKAHSRWRDHNSEFVQVESRLSNTAAKADNWLPINPGTEGALALGIAHVIIKESLYHKEFINNHTSGFNSWKRQVLDGYNPGIVSKITGVKESQIASLARGFARSKHPLAVCGRGEGRTPGSLKEFMAVHSLNALVGNINKTGGVWALPEPDYIKWPEPELSQNAKAGILKGRLDGAGKGKYAHGTSLLNRLPGLINSRQTSPVELLIISGANPCYSLPNSKAVREAFKKIPHVISFSSYMDETAESADLILPNHMFLERYQDIPGAFGMNQTVLGLAKPVIEPKKTRHVGDIILSVAKKMGGPVGNAFPWEDYKACLEQTLADKWNTLAENGYIEAGRFQPPEWSEGFQTRSGKFEFVNSDTESIVRFSLVKPEGDEAKYPLLLIPYDSMRLSAGYIGDSPFMMKTVEDTVLKGNDVLVEINPQTAGEYHLADGKYANLSTPLGKVKVRIHYYEGIRPGIVALPRGLGHTANDKFVAGKGVNYNEIADSKEDPASGHDAAWGIRAKLEKA